MILFKIILGIVIGIIQVGTSIQRTLYVDRGQISLAMGSSMINSGAYLLSIMFVAKEDYISYAGTALGALLACGFLAIKRKQDADKVSVSNT